MRKLTVFLTSAFILLSFQTAFSLKEQEKEEVRKQISSVKAWQLTEELNLSEEQAQALFPAQKAYEGRKKELEKQREATEVELDNLLEAREENKELIEKKLAQLKNIDEQTRTNEDQFRTKLSKILTVEQQAKYELFDKKFDSRLRQMIRDIKKEDQTVKSRTEMKPQEPPRQPKKETDEKKQRDDRQEKQSQQQKAHDESKKKSTSQEESSSKARSSGEKGSSTERSSRARESSNEKSSQENESSKEQSSRAQRH